MDSARRRVLVLVDRHADEQSGKKRENVRLQEGDELLVNGMREDILRAQDIPGVELAPERKLEAKEPQEDLRLHEIILLPGSPLLNRTLRGSQFRHRYGLQVLAQYRHGEPLM